MANNLIGQERYNSNPHNGSGAVGILNGARNVDLRVHGDITSANRDVYNIKHTGHSGERDILKDLASAACLEAGHEIVQYVDRPKCHEDTRLAVINDIMSWVDSNNPSEKLSWLKGPAGAGKSSIAQSVCIDCRKDKKLLSSFFFSRAVGGPRMDGSRLIATIAYQMMQAIPETTKYVLKELTQDPAMLSYTSKALDLQFTRLVLNPLAIVASQGNSTMPHVIVVDGLDEVNDSKTQKNLIKSFAKTLFTSDLNIKVLIASRPELDIRTAFDDPSINQITTRIELDSKYNPDKDINTYLTSEFSAIKRTHIISARLAKEINWPAQRDITELVRRSSGQFIYAATVLKYICDKRHDPVERLRQIISLRSGQDTPYKDLDELYTHILQNAAENANGFHNLLPLFQVLLFKEDESNFDDSSEGMENFLNITPIHIMLADLHSLIHVPITGRSVRIWHASFVDYLKNSSRSGQFCIHKKLAHKYLARRCLQIILNNLSEKIDSRDNLNIPYSRFRYLTHLANSDFDDELLDELLIMNKNLLHLIIDQMFMYMMLLDAMGDTPGEIIKYYFIRKNETFEPIEDKLLPLCKLISDSLDICAAYYMQRYACNYAQVIIIYCTMFIRSYNFGYEWYPFTNWSTNLLNNPDRGRHLYLGSKRCQHAWRTLWKLFRNPTRDDDYPDKDEHSTAILTVFQFLLKRIEPCRKFSVFLQEFKRTFKDWLQYRGLYKPVEWINFKKEIDIYIKKCKLLNTDDCDSDSDCNEEDNENISLTDGIVIQSPWIVLKSDPDSYNDIHEFVTYSDPKKLAEVRELIKLVSRDTAEKDRASQEFISNEYLSQQTAIDTSVTADNNLQLRRLDGGTLPETLTLHTQQKSYVHQQGVINMLKEVHIGDLPQYDANINRHSTGGTPHKHFHGNGGNQVQSRYHYNPGDIHNPLHFEGYISSNAAQGYPAHQNTNYKAMVTSAQWTNDNNHYTIRTSGNYSTQGVGSSETERQSWHPVEQYGRNEARMSQSYTAEPNQGTNSIKRLDNYYTLGTSWNYHPQAVGSSQTEHQSWYPVEQHGQKEARMPQSYTAEPNQVSDSIQRLGATYENIGYANRNTHPYGTPYQETHSTNIFQQHLPYRHPNNGSTSYGSQGTASNEYAWNQSGNISYAPRPSGGWFEATHYGKSSRAMQPYGDTSVTDNYTTPHSSRQEGLAYQHPGSGAGTYGTHLHNQQYYSGYTTQGAQYQMNNNGSGQGRYQHGVQ